MKAKSIFFYILMFLPLGMVLLSLPWMPDSIPAHYGMAGIVDRWGSKYELLIHPACSFLIGLLFLFMGHLAAKQEKQGKNNKHLMLLTGTLVLLVFNIITAYFLYTSFYQITNLQALPVNLAQLVFIALGIIVIIGNVMPKTRMNSIIGLRTPWSMKNEAVWRKCQRFGGISFIIVGFLIIISNILIHPPYSVALSLGLLLASLPCDLYYSYYISKKTGD